ncbi:MAG: fibronectin type III domain-containing protein [Methylococcales bacterium]|nr:fibronectin type III domain-containing protein [Methylococcales bacterium]
MNKIYLLVLAMTLLAVNIAFAADEIHWTVTGKDSVTFDWRGTSAENSIGYGLTNEYIQVTATTPNPVPVSSTGPFWEAKLTGLTANTRYYYKIGTAPERSFRTPPVPGSADFTVYAQGNIGSSSKYFNTGVIQDIIANDLPSFVIGLGDLTLGSINGKAAVDQHFNDVMLWSKEAAYMPVWGDKDTITSTNESFKNYKGRFAVPNPQTSPGSPLAGGEDWYWFDYGNVRFITLPEPWTGAWADWNTKAGTLMAQAQADSDIKFIVTFVHRPAYSSGHYTGSSTLKSILDKLGDTYSKYKLNINAHSNNYERSFPQHGVIHVTAGTGGANLTQDGACLWLTCTKPSWSAFRAMHLGVLKLHFTASGIEGSFICGPAGGGANDVTCTKGSVVDSFVIGSPLISATSGDLSSTTSAASVIGLLSGSATSSTTAANLTTEGKADWIHWGDASLNRKSGVAAQLSSYTVVGGGTVYKYSDDPRPLSWTDGNPTATGTNNKNGVYVAGSGKGFSFTAPADTSTRTLTVHVGGWKSGGTLLAHLSDGSAADFVDVTAAATGQYDRNYALSYKAASAAQTLTVSWKMNSGTGNVTLNGAALTSGGTAGTPPVTTIVPIAGPTISAVSVSNITQTGAKISWTLNQPATGQVEYGTTISYGSKSVKETSFQYSAHVQTLSGLAPGTLYHYRVRSTNQAGVESVSGDFTFTTAAVAATTTTTPPPPPTSGYHAPAPTSSLVVNVKNTGATANDATNDTAAIQAAVNQVGGTGGTVLVPAGIYMIDAQTSVKLKSNMTFKMESGAVLKAIPNNATHYAMVNILNVTNVNVVGGTFQGERHQHLTPCDNVLATSNSSNQLCYGQWGMGFWIGNASNIYVEGVTSREMWGDGFYVAGGYAQSKNINLYGVVADDNRRQGMSIENVNGMIIRDSVFSNTKGHWPMAGIDIEPYRPEQVVTNLQIINNKFTNNYSTGVKIYSGQTVSNVMVKGNTTTGGFFGVYFNGAVSGTVVESNTINNCSVAGIQLTGTGNGTVLTNNTITGCPTTILRN